MDTSIVNPIAKSYQEKTISTPMKMVDKADTDKKED
jgi:hypothetical protein